MVYRIRDRVEFDSATAEDTLYVDTVAGNDDYDGTVGSPLATIQEAVYRFIPPYAPVPNWSRSTVNTIQVVYTEGMSVINEPLHIPFHRGEGLLRIQADMYTPYSGLVQSGALVADGAYGDGYYTTHHQLNITTSPLTTGELVDGYFVVPQNAVSGKHEIERAYEYAPIYNNTTNSVDVVLGGPGVYTGFAYANTMVFDIVKPQVEWSYPDNNEGGSFYGQALITCDGGPVEISGFIFSGSDPKRPLLRSNAAPSPEYIIVGGTVLSKNIFNSAGPTSTFAYLFSGSGVWAAGNIVQANNNSLTLCADTNSCIITNMLIRDSDITSITNCANLYSIGISLYGNSGATDYLFVRDGSSGYFYYCDCRNAYIWVRSAATNFSSGLSVVNSPSYGLRFTKYLGWTIEDFSLITSANNGAYLEQGSSATLIGEISGSANSGVVIQNDCFAALAVTGNGNSEYGVEILDGGSAQVTLAQTSISGSLGEVKVGSSPVRNWGDGSIVDTTELCRLKEI